MQSEVITKVKDSPFFINIKETFQSQSKIYIVEEYLNKGNLLHYLNNSSVKIEEELLSVLLAEIVNSIEILH